jgi:hypothetical protein
VRSIFFRREFSVFGNLKKSDEYNIPERNSCDITYLQAQSQPLCLPAVSAIVSIHVNLRFPSFSQFFWVGEKGVRQRPIPAEMKTVLVNQCRLIANKRRHETLQCDIPYLELLSQISSSFLFVPRCSQLSEIGSASMLPSLLEHVE